LLVHLFFVFIKQQKRRNRALAAKRVINECVIGALKRFCIIAEKYRNREKRFGLRFNLIAGLYNLMVPYNWFRKRSIRARNGAQNLAIMRHMALNLLRNFKENNPKFKRTSIRSLRKKAGWNTRLLKQILDQDFS
jgi:hypothetical protein